MEKQINGNTQNISIGLELTKINLFIQEELRIKNETIRQNEKTIEELKNLVREKDNASNAMEKKALAAIHETDGNRQMINKLLGDISKLQNDNEWYKRTYEKRSVLGYIKEKFFRKKW
jgi:hypothetical protein